MNETTETTPNIDSAFLSLLQNHRRGDALTDLSQAMREVAEAVQLAGKPGVLTLKIKIEPAGNNGAFITEDEISIKLPKKQKETSIFFEDENGNLVRHNPHAQVELELRTVSGGAENQPETLKKVSVK